MVSGERSLKDKMQRERSMVFFLPRKDNNIGQAVCRKQRTLEKFRLVVYLKVTGKGNFIGF